MDRRGIAQLADGYPKSMQRLSLGQHSVRLFPVYIPATGLTPLIDTAGSLSMLPREKGGVVDAKLKVSIRGLHFAGY